jgi:hypothetical protein
MVVVLDDPRMEALLEQMPLSLPPRVETLRVDACEPVHAQRQALSFHLHQQVEVRSHQAPGVQLPVEFRGDAPEHHPEPIAVEVVQEYEPAGDALRGDVEDAVVGKR